MFANHHRWLARAVALAFACGVLAAGAEAQQPVQPSPAALAIAKELIDLKGGTSMFDPVITSVIEQGRGTLMQTSPQLAKDITDVATQLKTEFAPRRAELVAMAARTYASRFTEQELKEAMAFYKTPLGRKIIAEEPVILDQTFSAVQQWAAKFSEEVMARIRAEMKKKGHTL